MLETISHISTVLLPLLIWLWVHRIDSRLRKAEDELHEFTHWCVYGGPKDDVKFGKGTEALDLVVNTYAAQFCEIKKRLDAIEGKQNA